MLKNLEVRQQLCNCIHKAVGSLHWTDVDLFALKLFLALYETQFKKKIDSIFRMLDPPEPSLHLLKLQWPRHMYVCSCEAVTEHSELATSGKLDVPWWQVTVSVAFLVEVCSVIIPSS